MLDNNETVVPVLVEIDSLGLGTLDCAV